jgi:NAD(P)-dependent dehydrogenase (short-subunit alcohol dehydrogenase family)
MNRRKWIIGTAAVAVAGVVAYRATRRREPPPEAPPGAYVGPFGENSTAEEVTEGLDLAGRTILITGVNSGLGAESMRVLASRGARILGTARTMEKARAACEAIPGGRATPFAVELTDFDSVVACAEAVRALDTPLDVIMCNAGIMALPKLEQVNGIEKQFATNHLGHFLLVNRLRAPLEAAPQGRVVVLSSLGYRWAPPSGIEFDNLSGARGEYDPNRAYGQSKLANGLFSTELARRLAGTNATSNSVHPGVINTNLGRHFERWKRVAAGVIGWTFMKSVEAGAATQCYVSTYPALSKTTGLYFADCNPQVPGPRLTEDVLAARLWAVSEELVRPYLA